MTEQEKNLWENFSQEEKRETEQNIPKKIIINPREKRKKELQDKVSEGFLGFWIKNFRLSYLATAVVVLMGILAIVQIPKESMPEVELGMVTVTTVYPGANPEDIDSLITDKIYKAIKDIDGVDSIKSTSSLGVSNLQVSGKTGVDIKDIRSDIQAKIDTVTLPSDARKPIINTVETNANLAFSMYLYNKNNSATTDELMERAITLRDRLEKISSVDTVSVAFNATVASSLGSSDDDSKYQVEIVINNEKMQSYGLTLASISQAISGFNSDLPIGNFNIEDKSYDYRISGKNSYATEFLNTPITLPGGGNIFLRDIATLERKYDTDKDTTVIVNNWENFSEHKAIGLILSKTDSASVFGAAADAKKEIEKIFQEQGFQNYGYFYTSDIADNITTTYLDLGETFLETLLLVFAVMLVFVGFTDSLFATMMLPLAFLGTFIMLNSMGYTMNMLTNFSLIIALGIAIDTIIVFVQAASVKIKIGYDPQTAIILAFKEYAISIIVGTLTTIMVFIPIMQLPGVMGRFLAFIPVTIFGVLFFGLLFALTINGALYRGLIRPKKTYIEDPIALEYATDEQKELLELERDGKKFTKNTELSTRAKIIAGITGGYKKIMNKLLPSQSFRILAIAIPIGFFFFGFKFIAPLINFELMPADDNNKLSYNIKATPGMTTEATDTLVGDTLSLFQDFKEIKNISLVTSENEIAVNIDLTDKEERQSRGEMSAFTLDEKISKNFSSLKAKWLEITGGVPANGPSGSSDVGIKLEAESKNNLQELIATSKNFENFIDSLPETKNISNSSEDTPGQFIFTLKKELIVQKWIAPAQIYQTISQYSNGIKVAEIEQNGTDVDIYLKNDHFTGDVTPDTIRDIPLTIGKNTYRLGDFIETSPANSVSKISRDDGKIQITVGADLVDGANSIAINQKILDYAKNYNFPNGITFSAGGAQSDNSDLIISMLTSLALALMGIFALLTWQFNSYAKPAIVFYSVFMAIPFVFVGLLITGTPYSLMFGIGFIALMGISVNHGILLIEWADQNLNKWMDGFTALIESSSTRFEPMILTTLTTVLGMIPLTTAGAMWEGLAWTIIFGLIATTFIALFSLGSLYYELFVKERKEWFLKRLFRFLGKIITSIFSKKKSRK